MANRSYLYATNELAQDKNRDTIQISGVAECNYDIPVLFRAMCSFNPSVVHSIIWLDYKAAISGEFDGGLEFTVQFLKKLSETEFKKKKLITQEAFERFQNFFENLKGKNSHFILECLELYEMDAETEEEFPIMAERDIALVLKTRDQIQHFMNTGELDDGIYEELLRYKDYNCCIDFLSPYLYFDFSEEVEE